MRFRFIEENRASLPTERLCQIMNVSSRGYPSHQALVIIIQDRLGDPTEEAKGLVVAIQLGLRCRRPISRNKTGIAVRKTHDKIMRPILVAADNHIRLAKIGLGATHPQHAKPPAMLNGLTLRAGLSIRVERLSLQVHMRFAIWTRRAGSTLRSVL
jgi:hypothetical protein